MYEMQTIVTDVRGVCLSARPSVCHAARSVCAGSFGAAFARLLWLLVLCLPYVVCRGLFD